MKTLHYFLTICCSSVFFNHILAYDLPVFIDLGATNILNGGPKIESPGFYWLQHQLYYRAHKFLNECGKPIYDIQSPALDSVFIFAELLYQSKFKMLGGAPGISTILPAINFNRVSSNEIGLAATKSGVTNPAINFFFQWDAIHYNDRAVFIHRIGSFIFPPWSTNKYPENNINPGVKMTYIDTYWSASLFFTEKWVASWRLYYLWCSENKKNTIKPGNTFHMNYSTEYEVYKGCWLAINGYFLQQLQNNKKCGCEIPDSKERVFSVGPGIDIFLPHGFQLLGHLYFESKAINRTQGIATFINFIKYF